MERGLYAAASGMLAQQHMQDILADNIANASTVGYKQTNLTFRAVQTMALESRVSGQGSNGQIGELGLGVVPDHAYTDWQLGPITHTNNPLDASLAEGQFFAVSTPGGERYTRAGNFQLDGQGYLRTPSGQSVLDTGGRPVQVQDGQAHLDSQGNMVVGRQNVAQLKIVQAAPNMLVRQGDNLFAPLNPNAVTSAAHPQLRPGTLEQSNVNAVRNMVDMIILQRTFDISQRAVTTQDELLTKAASEVGKM